MAQSEDANANLLRELNQIYAVAPVGNKNLILEEAEEETRLLASTDFHLALQNRTAIDNSGKSPKNIPASKWWLAHPERREYKKVDFLPIPETPNGVFNMWKGFAVQPKGGIENIPLFYELFEEVICSGNTDWALYLWG